MSYMKTIQIEIGDLGGDGHEKTDKRLYVLHTDTPCDSVRVDTLITNACELLGVRDPRRSFCTEYEDSVVPVAFLEAIAPLPFDWTDKDEYDDRIYGENGRVEPGVSIGCEEWFDILKRLIEHGASEGRGTARLELIGGEYVNGGGYGLFY